MTKITCIKLTTEDGLFHCYVHGLNIFAANGLRVPALSDPRIVFLKALSEQVPCAAHVGSLAMKDLVDAPEELFGPPREELPYTRTRISFHDGFYDLNQYPCWDACFFPQVTPAFWEARLPEEERRDEHAWAGLDYLIALHGLALYVGASPSALDAMAALLNAPFSGSEQWLQETSRLFPLVVMMGHDGDYFDAYARDAASLGLLEPALARAHDLIQSSAWFQEHEEKLEWDEEYNLCLIAKAS